MLVKIAKVFPLPSFFFFFFFFPVLLMGQQPQNVPITLESPYNTMYAHLYYLQEDNYQPELAARTLYGVQDSMRARRLAIQLKQVLDGKGLYVRFNLIPQNPDFVDSLSQNAVFTPFPEVLPEVYLEKINDQWYYSAGTVENIPELHKRVYPFGMDLLLNLLPKLGQNKVLGLAIWQYAGLIILLTMAILLHVLLSRLLNPVVSRFSRSKIYPSLVGRDLVGKIARLISILIILRFIRVFLPPLQLPIEAANFAFITITIITTVLFVMLALRIIDVVMKYAENFTQKTSSRLDEQLMPIMRRVLQVVAVAAGLIQVLHVLNINVTTLIAGISIGGLALALAAQDTLKNLFGSLTIFMDKPFQIGDWINFSGVDGTVEEVGVRSTRVRTFANSLVYVPNGKLADMTINNYGERAYRRFKTTISITYDTPPLLIEKFVTGLRQIVETHPQTRKDYYEIHLNEMNASSLDILFYIFFAVPGWSDELKAKHEVLIAVIELAETLGVRFAFPTSTIHVEELPGAGNNSPAYEQEVAKLDEKLVDYLKRFKEKVGSE
jgi:MscS family membrane protein